MGLFKYFFYFLLIFLVFILFQYFNLPNIKKAETCFKTEMNNVYLCPKDKSYVKLNQISKNVQHAVVISEDASFFSHSGFDLDEIKNSFRKNLEKGYFARGGSTITQQLVKNLFLSKDKTISRKIMEIILASRIEKKYSKSFILEKYLNVVEFGKNIYGVKNASSFYFNKHPSELTPIEGAFLAFLLPNPTKYSSSYQKKELTPFARRRLKDILYKMNYYKKISSEDYSLAMSQIDTIFKPVPEMDDEPTEIDSTFSSDDGGVYDLTPPELLEQQQRESIEAIQDLKEEEQQSQTP